MTALYRAVIVTKAGGPEALTPIEMPVVEPRAGQLRVRVRAAGVGSTDLMLLAGKYLGVLTFLAIAVVFAAVLATVVAFAMAHGRHVPTAAWTSSAGISDLTRALGNLVLAVIGYASLGLAVGLFIRSSVFSVIIGFAWLLPIEQIVMKIVPATTPWLPGSALTIVGQGGTASVGYAHSLLVSLAYVVIAGALATVTFIRRDVTA